MRIEEMRFMENRARKKNILWITAGAILAILLICAGLIFSKYCFVGGRFYARNQYVYDLRGQELSVKNYQKLEKKLPSSWILWDVPFQDTTYSSDSRELSVFTLSDEDVDRLAFFPQLRVLHAEGCEDLPQLAEAQERYPQCQVLYNVEIGGRLYDQDTTKISLTRLSAEDAQRLEYLTMLESVDARGCYEYQLLEQLRQAHPEWNLSYYIRIGDGEFSRDAASVTTRGGTYDQLRGAFSFMPQLKTVLLTDPEAGCEELLQLREEFPGIDLQWEVTVFGQTLSWDIAELDLSGNILSGVEEAARLASWFPNLEKLIMSDCGIDDETMAAFREEKRAEYKVVWTVYFSAKCKDRTDDTGFYPTGQGEYHFLESYTPKLKYLEDLICVDLGHHSNIKTIDFVAYMPHLKYLILAHTDVRDISPISCLKELVFLELDNTPSFRDYTPLLGLTALEDLNLGFTYNDWTPLLQMTWLKHLWWTGRKDAYTIEAALKEVMPDCEMNFTSAASVGGGWRKLPNYYAMRDAINAPYDTSFN